MYADLPVGIAGKESCRCCSWLRQRKYHVFAGSKLTQVPYAVGYLTAKLCRNIQNELRGKAQFYFVDNLAKAFERFCGLRVKGAMSRVEIYFIETRNVLDYNCVALGLANETIDFGMAVLP